MVVRTGTAPSYSDRRLRSWHRFFSEWLAALRFSSEKKDPTRGPLEDCRVLRRRVPRGSAQPAGGMFIDRSKAQRSEP
jgi:hypothetical protein